MFGTHPFARAHKQITAIGKKKSYAKKQPTILRIHDTLFMTFYICFSGTNKPDFLYNSSALIDYRISEFWQLLPQKRMNIFRAFSSRRKLEIDVNGIFKSDYDKRFSLLSQVASNGKHKMIDLPQPKH